MSVCWVFCWHLVFFFLTESAFFYSIFRESTGLYVARARIFENPDPVFNSFENLSWEYKYSSLRCRLCFVDEAGDGSEAAEYWTICGTKQGPRRNQKGIGSPPIRSERRKLFLCIWQIWSWFLIQLWIPWAFLSSVFNLVKTYSRLLRGLPET